MPGPGRIFDFVTVTQIVMKLLQRFDQEKIDGKPDRSAPIGIAAEQPGPGFRRFIIDPMLHVP